MMKKLKKLLLLGVLATSVGFGTSVYAEESTTPSVDKFTENVYQEHTQGMTNEQMLADNIFVSDPDNIMTTEQQLEIYKLNKNVLENLKDKPQLVVIIREDIEGYGSIQEFANSEFKRLGVGQKGIDNGMLFALKVDKKNNYASREYWFETGYGMEGYIPDSSKDRLMNDTAKGYFKENNIGQGIVTFATNVSDRLIHTDLGDNQDKVDSLLKEQQDKEDWDAGVQRLKTFFWYVLMAILIIFIVFMTVQGIRYYLKQAFDKKLAKTKQILLDKKYDNGGLMTRTLANFDFKKEPKLFKGVLVNNLLVKTYEKEFEKDINQTLSHLPFFETVYQKTTLDYTNLQATRDMITETISKQSEQIVTIAEKSLVTMQQTVLKEPIALGKTISYDIVPPIKKNFINTVKKDLEFYATYSEQSFIDAFSEKLNKYGKVVVVKSAEKELSSIFNDEYQLNKFLNKYDNLYLSLLNDSWETVRQDAIAYKQEFEHMLADFDSEYKRDLTQLINQKGFDSGHYLLEKVNTVNTRYNYYHNISIQEMYQVLLTTCYNECLRYNINKPSFRYRPYRISSFDSYFSNEFKQSWFETKPTSDLNRIISELVSKYEKMLDADHKKELRDIEEEEERKREGERRRRKREEEEEEERRRQASYSSSSFSSSSSSSFDSGSSSSFGGGSSGGGGFGGVKYPL